MSAKPRILTLLAHSQFPTIIPSPFFNFSASLSFFTFRKFSPFNSQSATSENSTMAASINQLGFVIFAMILVSCSISAMADSESAFIVAHKKATLTKLSNGVERISVSIDLYNRGSLTVYDVSLVDKSWPVDSFDVVSGNFSRSWDSLDAGAIVSHSIELEPRVKGLFQGSPAVITFRIPNKAAPVVSYSTPIFPLNMLADTTPENKLEVAKSLLARFGPQFSAVSLVALFGYMIATPKSNAAKAQKKRR